MNDYSEIKEDIQSMAEGAVVDAVKKKIESYLPEDTSIEESTDQELEKALKELKEDVDAE